MDAGNITVKILGDMANLKACFNDLKGEFSKVSQGFQDMGKGISEAGKGLTTGISVPAAAITASLGATVKVAADFDTNMRRVATMLPGLTEEGFKEISDQCLQLSQTFGTSSGEMSNAMYQALSSGIPKENIFSFMQQAEQLAIGGATNVTAATDVLTNSVNAYGQANLSAAQAADIIFQGTKFGKSTVDELSQSLANVVPSAAQAGVSFADVNAALAAMTIQGTPTAQATTQLRGILDELTDSTSSAFTAFQQLAGQTFQDFIKSGHSVGDAMQILQGGIGKTIVDTKKLDSINKQLGDSNSDLSKSFEKLTGQTYADYIAKGGTVQGAASRLGLEFGKQANSMKDYFGRIEAGNGALELTGNGQALYNQALDGTTKSLGSAEEAYKTMEKGAGQSLAEIKSNLEALTIKLGEEFLPVLRDTILPLLKDTVFPFLESLIPIIGNVASTFNNLSKPVKETIIAISGFIVALGPALMILGPIVSAIGTALALIASPLGVLIAAVAAFAFAWAKNWDGIRDKAGSIFEGLKSTVETLFKTIQTLFSQIVSILGPSVENLKRIFEDIMKVFEAFFSGSSLGPVDTAGIAQIIGGLINAITGHFAKLWDRISGILIILAPYIKEFFSELPGLISSFVSALIPIFDTLSGIFEAGMNEVKNILALVLPIVLQLWGVVSKSIKEGLKELPGVIAGFITFLTPFWNSIKGLLDQALISIPPLLNALWPIIQDAFKTGQTIIKEVIADFGPIWEDLQKYFSLAIDTITGFLSDNQPNIDTLQTTWDGLKEIFYSVVDALGPVIDFVKSVFDAILEFIIEFYANLGPTWENLKDIWSSVSSIFAEIIKDLMPVLGDFFESLGGSKTQEAGSAGKTFADVINVLTGKIADFLRYIKQHPEIIKFAVSLAAMALGIVAWLINTGIAITAFILKLIDAFLTAEKKTTDTYNFLSDIFNKIYETVKKWLTDAFNFIVWFFLNFNLSVTGNLTGINDTFTKIFTDIYNTIKQKLTDAYNFIVQEFTAIYNTINQKLTEAYNFINQQFTAIYDTVKKWLTDAFNFIVWFFLNFNLSVTGNLTGINDTFTKIFTDIYNTIKQKLTDAYNFIVQEFTAIYTTIKQKLTDAYNFVVQEFTAIYTAVSKYLTDAYNFVVQEFTAIYTTIKQKLTDAYNFVVQEFTAIYTAVSKYLTDAYNFVVQEFTAIYTTIKQKLTDAYNFVVQEFTAIYTTIKQKLTDAYNFVVQEFTAIPTIIKQKLTEAYNSVVQEFTAIYNTLKQTLTDTYNFVVQIFTNIPNIIQQKLTEAYNSVVLIFSNLPNTIRTAMNNAYTAITTALNNAISFISKIDLYQAGKNFIQNFIDGIKAMAGTLGSTINNLLSDARSYFPFSPAKKGPLMTLPNWDSYVIEPLKKSLIQLPDISSLILSKVSALLPHSLAKTGPLSNPINWDSYFSNPVTASLQKMQGNVQNGLGNVSRIVQNTTNNAPTSHTYEGDSFHIGPINNTGPDLDIRKLMKDLTDLKTNDRRQRGFFK